MTALRVLTVLACYAAATETVFTLAYGLLFPWRSTELGRQMLLYSVCVAGLMDLAVLGLVWTAPMWVWLASYAVFGAALTWRLVILLRMWRAGRRPAGKS